MVSYDYVMVRFGELSTKGKNKKDFIHTLFLNIKHALKDYDVKVESRFDHIYVYLNGNEYQPIIDRLQDVSGIQGLSLVARIENDIEKIKESSLELIKLEEGKTFKVKVKRSNKKFPLHSEEITRIVTPLFIIK